MQGFVAIILHAHLPYVRHPEHVRSLEERWLYEAMWESYLPLLDMLDGLSKEGVRAPITLSLSPTLVAMLDDSLLRERFDDYLERLARLALREEERTHDADLERAIAFYRERIERQRCRFGDIDRDIVGAFATLAEQGAIELATTSATHAYLPALRSCPASIRAQLRLGMRSFAQRFGAPSRGFWLPECAFDPRLDQDLAAAGVGYTVLDAHALELGRPLSPLGVYAPVLGPNGVAYFARDPDAAREVWSRKEGYPGHPDYREFYRDVGFDRDADELEGHIGPDDTRIMTGLKLHRITGAADFKAPYIRERALERARLDAEDFVARRQKALALAPCFEGTPPITVAPYDAELFGHWWLEGPEFLGHVLRSLGASHERGELEPVSLGGFLERFPEAVRSMPAASSWGEGGYGQVWTGRAASALWRHVHHAEAIVTRAVARARSTSGVAGDALDQSIRELLLLEASDFPFMLARGEMTEYAEARMRAHHKRAFHLAEIAMKGSTDRSEIAWLREVEHRDRFLDQLSREALRDAFDPL